MTEAELFAAYRVAAGYLAQCACGLWIRAASSANPRQIGSAVRVHNESTEHQQWVHESEAVTLLQQIPVHICRCHLHGGSA